VQFLLTHIEHRNKSLTLELSLVNVDKVQRIIAVLRQWAEDERIPEDARQEMVDALTNAMHGGDEQ
jgi:phosphoenolpyruvate synthase/pyruvate phosphate dikinase